MHKKIYSSNWLTWPLALLACLTHYCTWGWFVFFSLSLSLRSLLYHVPCVLVQASQKGRRQVKKSRTKTRRAMGRKPSPKFSLAHVHINRSPKLHTSWSGHCTPLYPWPSYPAGTIHVSTLKWFSTPTAMSAARSCSRPRTWVTRCSGHSIWHHCSFQHRVFYSGVTTKRWKGSLTELVQLIGFTRS